VAEYLRPYLKRLTALERSLYEFPANATIPWAEIENEVLDPTSPENIREVGDRYGVEKKALYDMSRKRKWTKRRAVVMELHSRQTTARALASSSHAMVGGSGRPDETIIEQEEEMLGLVKECIGQIKNSLAAGLIPFRSAGDVDKIVRLLLVVQGKADSIRENRNSLSAADLERIAAKVGKNLKVDAAMAGLVVQEADFDILDEPPETDPLPAQWDESEAVEEPATS
jgi:hypothetical protein